MRTGHRRYSITVQSVLLNAHNIITRAEIAIVRDLCTKPLGKTATEAKIARICRKIDRINSRIASRRYVLSIKDTVERAIKLLRLLEADCQKEIDRATWMRKEFYELMQADYEVARRALASMLGFVADGERTVVIEGIEYAERGSSNCQRMVEGANTNAYDSASLQQKVEDAIGVLNVDVEANHEAFLRVEEVTVRAEAEVRDEISSMEVRVLNLGYELETFNKPLIKLLLNSDQPTRLEIGKLIFPEDFKETE